MLALRLFFIAALTSILALVPLPAPTTYFVPCGRILPTVATRALAPGDTLLFERACFWTGTLKLDWVGTAAAPITIGAYGDPALARPLIQANAGNRPDGQKAITAAGSYLVISSLQAKVINPYRDPSCMQPDGLGVRYGFHVAFNLTGHHLTLTDVEASEAAIGINMVDASHDIVVRDSYVHGLHTLWNIEPPTNALGVIGVNLHGTDQEVAGSRFEDNFVACTRASDGAPQSYGAPFEFYNAVRTNVHHNVALGHRKTAEYGRDPDRISTDNRFAYNLIVSSQVGGRGPNIHGVGIFGPISNTTIAHNTIILTGATSQALICGCVGGASVTDNILAAETKAAYFNGGFTARNVYWDYQVTSDPLMDPYVQGVTVASAWKLNPKLDSAYHPTAASTYPQAGAFPYVPPVPTATPTLTPTVTATPTLTATPSPSTLPTLTATPTLTASATQTGTTIPPPTSTLEHCVGWRDETPEAIPCP